MSNREISRQQHYITIVSKIIIIQKSKFVCIFFINSDSKLAEQLEKKHKYGTSSSNSSQLETGELARVKEEMAELYRSKCQNDQRLIDANHRIADFEKKSSAIIAE